MAVRLNRAHDESTRQKIQVTQLIKRLQGHAMGEIEMTATQIDAAKFLLNKRIPNPPQSFEHSGEVTTRLIING